jgi:hypothetical protein
MRCWSTGRSSWYCRGDSHCGRGGAKGGGRRRGSTSTSLPDQHLSSALQPTVLCSPWQPVLPASCFWCSRQRSRTFALLALSITPWPVLGLDGCNNAAWGLLLVAAGARVVEPSARCGCHTMLMGAVRSCTVTGQRHCSRHYRSAAFQ